MWAVDFVPAMNRCCGGCRVAPAGIAETNQSSIRRPCRPRSPAGPDLLALALCLGFALASGFACPRPRFASPRFAFGGDLAFDRLRLRLASSSGSWMRRREVATVSRGR